LQRTKVEKNGCFLIYQAKILRKSKKNKKRIIRLSTILFFVNSFD